MGILGLGSCWPKALLQKISLKFSFIQDDDIGDRDTGSVKEARVVVAAFDSEVG